jgi:ABC-2 type transport system permease protein
MPIFDQGYQHWQGPLSRHRWRWLAIARHGVRVQLKNRILRFLLLISWAPAVALVVAVALWGLVEQRNETILPLVRNLLPPEIFRDPIAYRVTVWTLAYSFFFKFEIFCIFLLVVVAGPGLISRDLRFNAMPLYLSRPLTRLDYFVGKLGVIGALVASVAVGPAVVAYIVGVCFSMDLSVVKDTFGVLLGSVAYGLVITLSAGTLMLALSSLTSRSLYVGIAFAGLCVISSSVGASMTGQHSQALHHGTMQKEMRRWVADHPPPPGVQMHGSIPQVTWNPKNREFVPDVPSEQQAAAQLWYRSYREVQEMAWVHVQIARTEAAREDWRPLCSYLSNLGRLADLLLDTDSAWVALGNAALQQGPGPPRPGPGPRQLPPAPPSGSERLLADFWVAQYPWWWSAAVLSGLLGLSTWVMTRRVKSLDRLK